MPMPITRIRLPAPEPACSIKAITVAPAQVAMEAATSGSESGTYYHWLMVAQHNVGSIGSGKRPVAIEGLVTRLFQVSALGGHAAFTAVAFHTWRGDREDNALANLQIRVAGGANDSDSFVAEDAGAWCAAAAKHGVSVGATDGGGGEFDKRFAILQVRDGNLVDAEVTVAVPHQGAGGF